MQLTSRSFATPRAVQNARTRIFIPGSDPRFGSFTRTSSAARSTRPPSASQSTFSSERLFTPGLLDRLQTPLTRYSE